MSAPLVCCFGEVLWDVLPSARVPGGAPMNVAIHLKNIGVNVEIISRVGADMLGKEIRKILQEKNCSNQLIQTDQRHSTGVVNANVSKPKEVTYEIVAPAAWDFIQPDDRTLQIVSQADAFVFGTLACRNECSRNTLLELLGGTRALKVFDVNFRTPFYTQRLTLDLMKRTDIVKMNRDEMEIIGGWLGLTHLTLEKKMEELKNQFGLKMVLVTFGEEGAALLDDSGLYSSPVYPVQVKDTIGSGDAFLAGCIKNILTHATPVQTLNYACAIGSLVASHQGANPNIDEQMVFELMKSV